MFISKLSSLNINISDAHYVELKLFLHVRTVLTGRGGLGFVSLEPFNCDEMCL